MTFLAAFANVRFGVFLSPAWFRNNRSMSRKKGHRARLQWSLVLPCLQFLLLSVGLHLPRHVYPFPRIPLRSHADRLLQQPCRRVGELVRTLPNLGIYLCTLSTGRICIQHSDLQGMRDLRPYRPLDTEDLQRLWRAWNVVGRLRLLKEGWNLNR